MDRVDEDRSGVILVRAWVHDGRVVARVRSTLADGSEHEVALGVGVDPILEIVRAWLHAIEATQR
jgi:hypothetical protein